MKITIIGTGNMGSALIEAIAPEQFALQIGLQTDYPFVTRLPTQKYALGFY